MQLLDVYISNSGSSVWLNYSQTTYCSWLKHKGYLDGLLLSDIRKKHFNEYLEKGSISKLTRKQVCS
ncbi:hypothetical protein 12VC501_gene0059 [Vibrio phage 12VC501]|nr:hypothetical protein 12VC501_gene0059 [Vibrio phage 12VC501]